MNIKRRVMILILGLGVAWFAMWGANEMNAWETKNIGDILIFFCTTILKIFVLSYGIGFLLYWGLKVFTEVAYSYDIYDSIVSVIIAICFGFLFVGASASTGRAGTISIGLLLLLGLLPVTFSITHVIMDIVATWRGRTTDSTEKEWTRRTPR